ncbi:MAG: hypothetical protein GY861_02605 [bacterium]|nr:hypothetical protein [bacterium]
MKNTLFLVLVGTLVGCCPPPDIQEVNWKDGKPAYIVVDSVEDLLYKRAGGKCMHRGYEVLQLNKGTTTMYFRCK